jgi:hypothetical protein
MGKIFRALLDWSEVWATLVPIAIFLFNRKQPKYMYPVIAYFFLALLINLSGNIIADFKRHLPEWLQSNNPLYNFHSMVRFVCFSLFFTGLEQHRFKVMYKVLPVLSLLIFLLNFLLVDRFFNPDHLSGNLLAAEAYLLLVYCMLYYLNKLRDDDILITGEPDFWVVTGLSVYVVVNFFVFLFYVPMIRVDSQLADRIWDIHNYAYIILCMLTAKAFYDLPRYQYSV